MYLYKIHIPLDQGAMEPKSVMETIRGGGELLLESGINLKALGFSLYYFET